MTLAPIRSEQELEPLLDSNQEFLLAFLIEQNQGSVAARDALEQALSANPEARAFSIDARTVRNVPGHFQVTAVPTVLRVRGHETLERLVGPQPPGTYAALMTPKPRSANQNQTKADTRARVKLYVTNTCPWCRKLESYLERRGVHFTKVNVSTDAAAARAMVRKSGQQGVPQAEIDGTMVVGFDKARIDQLLRLERE
jgi:glutaredoxin-like YruB-family protein